MPRASAEHPHLRQRRTTTAASGKAPPQIGLLPFQTTPAHTRGASLDTTASSYFTTLTSASELEQEEVHAALAKMKERKRASTTTAGGPTPAEKLKRAQDALASALERANAPDAPETEVVAAGRKAMELAIDSVDDPGSLVFGDRGSPKLAEWEQQLFLVELAKERDPFGMGMASIVAFVGRALASGVAFGILKSFLETGLDALFVQAGVTNPALQVAIKSAVVGLAVGLAILAYDIILNHGLKSAVGTTQVPVGDDAFPPVLEGHAADLAHHRKQTTRLRTGEPEGSGIALGCSGLIGAALAVAMDDEQQAGIVSAFIGSGMGLLAQTAINFMLSTTTRQGARVPAFKVARDDRPLARRTGAGIDEAVGKATAIQDAAGRPIADGAKHHARLHTAARYVGSVAQGALIEQLVNTLIDRSTPAGRALAGGLPPTLFLASYYANSGARAARAGHGRPFGPTRHLGNKLMHSVRTKASRLFGKSGDARSTEEAERAEAMGQLAKLRAFVGDAAKGGSSLLSGTSMRMPVTLFADTLAAIWSAGESAVQGPGPVETPTDIEMQPV